MASKKATLADRQASHDLLFKLCRKGAYGQYVEDGKSYNNMWKIEQILEEHPHLVSNKEAIPGSSGKTALHVAAETQTTHGSGIVRILLDKGAKPTYTAADGTQIVLMTHPNVQSYHKQAIQEWQAVADEHMAWEVIVDLISTPRRPGPNGIEWMKKTQRAWFLSCGLDKCMKKYHQASLLEFCMAARRGFKSIKASGKFPEHLKQMIIKAEDMCENPPLDGLAPLDVLEMIDKEQVTTSVVFDTESPTKKQKT